MKYHSFKLHRCLSLIILLFFAQRSTAQTYVTIADPAFASWLNSNYPFCMNGNLLNTECSNIQQETFLYFFNSTPFTSLDGIQYFTSLNHLSIDDNTLTSIPALPPNLEFLNVYDNNLTSLPALPATLKHLYCGGNPITTLPALPNGLNTLSIYEGPTIQLPLVYPDSLIALSIAGCNLGVLPDLPQTLTYLDCQSNQLTALPDQLPPGLTSFSCWDNLLTELPDLPATLTYLDCSENLLTWLPDLPPVLTTFGCYENQLTVLPILPEGLIHLYCSSNQIHCYGGFPLNLETLEAGNNPATCLPNYVSCMSSELLSLPLCDENSMLSNPYECPGAMGINGSVYTDLSGDCFQNQGEGGVPGIQVKLYNNSGNFLGLSYTNTTGKYHFPNENATYTVALDTVNAPFTTSCDADSVVTIGSALVDSVNFSIDCDGLPDLGIQSIAPAGLVFPGQLHTLNVSGGNMLAFYPFSCLQNTGGTVTVAITGPVSYSAIPGGAIAPTQINGNTFTYEVTDFSQLPIYSAFQLLLQTDTTAQAGDTVCVTATITTLSPEQNASNNSLSLCYSIGNSFDPNFKEAWPSLVPDLFNDPITYTIHFQNTGTAPAINIRLKDELDAHLDPSTFELMGSSHPVVTSLYGHQLQFRFNNILLDDSVSNEPESHGFVQYRIRPIDGLVHGETIENTAGIYFDFNDPVITNTAIVYYSTLSTNELFETTPILSPNPAREEISLHSVKPFESLDIFIRDLNGRTLQTQTFHSWEPVQLSVSDLSEGYYLLELHVDHSAEPAVIPFIKE